MTTIKQAPQCIESEQALIGAILLDSSAYDDVIGVVQHTDFFRLEHAQIFSAIETLVALREAVDVVTIFGEVAKTNTDKALLAYLGELANAAPSSRGASRYAKTISDKSKLRAIIAAADLISGQAYEPRAEPEQIIDAGHAALMQLGTGYATTEPVPIRQALADSLQHIEDRYSSGAAISGASTGLAALDEKLDGLHDGELVIIAGRPSMGKTALVINIAEHVAATGSVFVFSLEMSAKQVINRSLAGRAMIDAQRINAGRITEGEWATLTNSSAEIAKLNIIFDESSSPTVEQIISRARVRKIKHGLDAVVIDYLQLIPAGSSGENRNSELSSITRALKCAARELGVPIILASQLSRKVDDRAIKRPMMSDLRDSGAIEQDADVVMMIYRDEYYNKDSRERGIAELIIAKNRNGPTGEVLLRFDAQHTKFATLGEAQAYDIREGRAASAKSKRFVD